MLPIISLTSTPNTICDENIGADGTLTATITNKINSDTYTYEWTDIFPDAGDPLIADTDSVVVQRDSSTYRAVVTHVETGCVSDPVEIDVDVDFFIPPIAIAITNQTSCDDLAPNGKLSASIDETLIGGSATERNGYTYEWRDNGAGPALTMPGAIIGTDSIATDLNGNLYFTLNVVRDLTGCTNSESVFLPEIIVFPIVATTVSSDVTRCDTPDGKIIAGVGAGVDSLGYTFFWLNEEGLDQTTDADFIINNPSTTLVERGAYDNLIPGNYTVVARDNFTSCISQPVTEVVDDNTIQTITNITLGPVLPSTCGATDGEMTGTVAGGVGPFNIFWHFGGPVNDSINFFDNPPAFTPPDDVPFASTLNSNVSSINSLESRLYTLIVFDQGNDFVDIGDGNRQAFQNMATFTGFAQQVDSAACNHLPSVANK